MKMKSLPEVTIEIMQKGVCLWIVFCILALTVFLKAVRHDSQPFARIKLLVEASLIGAWALAMYILSKWFEQSGNPLGDPLLPASVLLGICAFCVLINAMLTKEDQLRYM